MILKDQRVLKSWFFFKGETSNFSGIPLVFKAQQLALSCPREAPANLPASAGERHEESREAPYSS